MFSTGGEDISRFNFLRTFRNTYNRSTFSVLCAKSIFASLVQATADGSEQAQRHDEFRNQRKDPGRLMENFFQPERQENSILVKKLKTTGLERSSIVKVTDHQNEKSLDDYERFTIIHACRI